MVNTATVIFTDGARSFSPAVYLYGNGGPVSIYAFLDEMDRQGVMGGQDYECASFIAIVGAFLGPGSFMLGVVNGPKSDTTRDLGKVRTDHSGNGFYLVRRSAAPVDGVTPITMRRFREAWWVKDGESDPELVELSSGTVIAEEKKARESDYGSKVGEFYDRLYGEKNYNDLGQRTSYEKQLRKQIEKKITL